MNYIAEINAFHEWLETHPIDATTQALWFHLMAIANKCGWPEWFTVANTTLQAKLRVDKKTVIRHRNILIREELIRYKKGLNRQAGKYALLLVSSATRGNIPPEMGPKRDQTWNQLGDHYINKTKTKQDHIYSVFDHWNTKNIIKHKKLTDKLASHINARLKDGYTADEIIGAIDNYATVLHGEDYFWTYKWTLEQFLTRGLDRFRSENKPLDNFRSTQSLRDNIRPKGDAEDEKRKERIKALMVGEVQ